MQLRWAFECIKSMSALPIVTLLQHHTQQVAAHICRITTLEKSHYATEIQATVNNMQKAKTQVTLQQVC